MSDTPRVVIVRLRGNNWRDYWRWICTADHGEDYPLACRSGNWTLARFAHDDGREHARHCAALRLAKLLARIAEKRDYYSHQARMYENTALAGTYFQARAVATALTRIYDDATVERTDG